MNDHVRIGLHGYTNTGKDEFASALKTQRGFVKLAFADALYKEVSEAYDLPISALTHRPTKEQEVSRLSWGNCKDSAFGMVCNALGIVSTAPLSARRVLQLWGTEYRRTQDKTYWIKKWVEKAKEHEADGDTKIVIPDVRFEDEAEFIVITGGKIIRVDRPGCGPVGAHVSENELNSKYLCATMLNAGTLHDLSDAAVYLADHFEEL